MLSPSFSFEEVEYVLRQSILRLLPADLEVLLPILGPRPPVIIDIAGIGLGQLRWPAVGIAEIAQALDVCITPVRVVGGCSPHKAVGGVQGLDERFGIVKYRLVIESDELAARVVSGLVGLHRLHLAAEFEHRVRKSPSLHIRGPGDQRGPVPKSYRLPVPLRDLLHVLLSDQHLPQEVRRNAGQELDLPGGHGELEVSAL
jgi:hypothetical protein